MPTATFNQPITSTYSHGNPILSVIRKFSSWCHAQDINRLLWLGVILAAHGCIITPLTVMTIMFNGLNFPLFMLAMVAMSMALVTNLAAMPTKYTIPTFALSLLIDLGIIITSFALS